jgi:hypothetical protein
MRAGDLAEPPPFGAQPVDQGVVPLGALGVLPVGAGVASRFRQRRALFPQGGRGRGIGQAGAVGGGALLDGLGEVLPQVEPVGDLDRLRRPGAGSG